jgi:hypothetical protein
MALGQAAGIAAVLAVHRGLTVHNVQIRELKNKQDIHRTVAEGQGGDWDDLGVYPFDRGSPGTQTITIETNGTDSPVVMNAVKLVKV